VPPPLQLPTGERGGGFFGGGLGTSPSSTVPAPPPLHPPALGPHDLDLAIAGTLRTLLAELL
jgi:hypothetical protein